MAVDFKLLGVEGLAAEKERESARGQQALQQGFAAVERGQAAEAQRGLLSEQLGMKERLEEKKLSQAALQSAQKLDLEERKVSLAEQKEVGKDITNDAKKQDAALTGFAEILVNAPRGDKPALLDSFKSSLKLAGVPQEALDSLNNEEDLKKELIERGLKIPERKSLSAEDKKLKSLTVGALSSITKLTGLKSIDLIESKIPGSDKAQFDAVRRSLTDTISRLRSGAALTEFEVQNFSKLVPQIQDSPATKRFKLEQLQEQFAVIAEEYGIDPEKFGIKKKEVDPLQAFTQPSQQLFIKRMRDKGVDEGKIIDFLKNQGE